jgi:DNA-binding IscR family transcriptional regulator
VAECGSRAARAINIGTLVRRTEPDLHLMPCFGSQSACTIQPKCVLAVAVNEALRALLTTLDRYSLVDLVRLHAAMTRLLLIEEATESAPARHNPSQVLPGMNRLLTATAPRA